MELQQVLPVRVREDLRVIAIQVYFTLIKFPESEPHTSISMLFYLTLVQRMQSRLF